MNQTAFFTNIFERVFNSGSFLNGSSSLPSEKGIVRPSGPTGPTAPPLYLRPTAPPFYLRPASTPIDKRPNLRPVYKWTTVTPGYKRTTVTPVYKRTTVTPVYKGPKWKISWPTTRERWELIKPPKNEVKSTHATSNTGWGHSNLENLIWVALGGFVVLMLLAIFMKLGNPIRRVRRQLSNVRPAPNLITRRQNPDDRNLDMGSLLRLTDTAASTDAGPLYDDLPPPYSECAYTKHDTEEPPPCFSACFVTYTNTKDTEPKVHIQRQNVLFEDDAFAMNDSENIDGIRTELALVNGRIVERPKLELNNHNNETEVASNNKGRVVFNDETDHVKVNIY